VEIIVTLSHKVALDKLRKSMCRGAMPHRWTLKTAGRKLLRFT